MTKKDFFIIIIKLFGLYTCITTLFSFIPALLPNVQLDFPDTFTILYFSASLVFFLLLIIYLLNHADKVADFLKLDKGFDSDMIHIEKLDRQQVIQLGLIIVGGLLFLEHLPSLLTNCFYLFKSMAQDYEGIEFRSTENYVYTTQDFIAVVLGYLVFTNHDKIAQKLFKQ